MPANSLLFQHPAVWKSHRFSTQPPAALYPWLFEYDSLTQELRNRYGADFKVDVLFQQWRPAFNEECRQLGVAQHRYQMIREVLLIGNEQPLILARTVMPSATIATAHRKLSGLGSRPLGEVLFAYPDLQRRQRQISHLSPDNWNPDLQKRFSLDTAIWGRRTIYAIHQQPLMVAEFFLPGLIQPRTL